MTGAWSVSRRLTLWFAVTTSLLVGLAAGAGTWAVFLAVERELSALVFEELEEMRLRFTLGGGTRDDFRTIASDLQSQHPANPLSWTVCDGATGSEWLRLGNGPDPAFSATRGITREGHLRAGWTSLSDELHLGVAVDGSTQLRLAARFRTIATVLVLASAIAASLIGRLLGRRFAGQLQRVATDIRTVPALGSDVVVDADLPEEIGEIVRALRHMLENIQNEIEQSRLLTAGLAHELRSPIQNVLGAAEVALLRTRSEEAYREVLQRVIRELRELGRVVDNLVTLSASDDFRRQRIVEHFDLGLEARLRLEREQTLARDKGVDLELEAAAPLECRGDREAILLALRNLVTNAIDWTEPDGRVRVQLAALDGRVRILVDDAGPGVPAEERDRIFEPFYRGPRVNGRRIGYGLGLALARSAVESHGGTIAVEDSPLGGARFRIDLPGRGSTDSARELPLERDAPPAAYQRW